MEETIENKNNKKKLDLKREKLSKALKKNILRRKESQKENKKAEI